MAEPLPIRPGAGRAQGACAILVGRQEFRLDPSGAAWWPEERTLVVADLHLEKGSALAARGVLLPPYDSAATLDRLARVVAARKPRRVIALGDSFHDSGGPSRLAPEDAARLLALQHGRDWIWIAGNHDPGLVGMAPGDHAETLVLSGLALRHEPTRGPALGEVAGHLHPAARLLWRGRSLRRRCFAGDGARLILPAFGAYAGGLNLLDSAFAGLFAPGRLVAALLGRDGVHPVSPVRLVADRSSQAGLRGLPHAAPA